MKQAREAIRAEQAKSSLEMERLRFEYNKSEERCIQLAREKADLLERLQEQDSNNSRAEDNLLRLSTEKVCIFLALYKKS